MAQSFLASDGDIKAVLRTMFDAPEFWAPAAERAKVKTPEEFVVSAVRASGAEVKNALPLVQALDKLGMPLYGMQTPNGYCWMAEQWVNTGELVSRMNFALVLSGDRLPGVRTDWPRLLGAARVGDEAGCVDGRADRIRRAAKEEKLERCCWGAAEREDAGGGAGAVSRIGGAQQAAKEFPIGRRARSLMAGRCWEDRGAGSGAGACLAREISRRR